MGRPSLVLALVASATVAIAACRRSATPTPTDSPGATRVFPVAAPVQPRRLRPAPRPEVEALLGELRGTNEVGGWAVGYSANESPFHRIGTQLLPTADASLIAWLAADDDPTLRALGLWG